MIEFDWDPAKAKRNLKSHGVSFDEAKTVFFDDFARQFYDEGQSEDEDRFLLLGISNTSRILLICHCEIESKDVIRIISARKATAKERQLYEGPTP
ncbi:MAG: BrnT family toxin [Granulosicoccus sp.]|nr:BrnT family toxin [Granulosicoccus sp.]